MAAARGDKHAISKVEKQVSNCNTVHKFLDTLNLQLVDNMRDLIEGAEPTDDLRDKLGEVMAGIKRSEKARLELIAETKVLEGLVPLTRNDNVPALREIFHGRLEGMSSEWSDDAVEHSKAVEDAKAVLRAIDPGSDDVQAGPAVISLICPFTRKRLTDPVRSKICRHTFERATAVKLAQQNKLRCPVVGCEHAETKLKVSDLEEDRAAKRALVEQANKAAEDNDEAEATMVE